MRESKIVSSFSRSSDSNLNTKAQFILSSMTGNAYFPSPVPALTAVTNAIEEFDLALAAAQTRDVVKISMKNDKRSALIAILKQLASYVELLGNGDKTILLSSGYDLAKEGTDSLVLGKVQNFGVQDGGGSGKILSKADGVPNAASYLHCITTDPLDASSVWKEQASTSVSYIHEGLSSGVKYWFLLKAVGRKNQIESSSPVSRVSQ